MHAANGTSTAKVAVPSAIIAPRQPRRSMRYAERNGTPP